MSSGKRRGAGKTGASGGSRSGSRRKAGGAAAGGAGSSGARKAAPAAAAAAPVPSPAPVAGGNTGLQPFNQYGIPTNVPGAGATKQKKTGPTHDVELPPGAKRGFVCKECQDKYIKEGKEQTLFYNSSGWGTFCAREGVCIRICICIADTERNRQDDRWAGRSLRS